MKNIAKKSIVAAFCGALLLSTTACADTSWSIKNDDETLSIGTYIYYMSEAYGEAKEKSGKKGDEVLSATIEKKTGDEWIRDRAKELCLEQLTVNKLCKDNKVKISDSDLEATYNDTSAFYGYSSYAQMWIYSKQAYEGMGVSEDSYKNATVGTILAKSNLFDKIYGKGGSQEVKDSELEKYFTENYVSFKYFNTSFSTIDEEGNSTTLSDEEKERVKVRYEHYEKMINEEGKSFDDVIAKYKEDAETETDPSQESLSELENLGFDDEVKDKLKKTADNKASYIATDTGYYFVYKMPIKDKVNTLKDEKDTSTRSNVLHSLKNDDFTKYIEEQAKKAKYDQNDAAFSKYTPSRVIPASDNEKSEESSEASEQEESSNEESTESKEDNSTTSNQESTANENTSTTSTQENSTTSTTSNNESSTSSTTSNNASSKPVESSTANPTSSETSNASAPESTVTSTASAA